MLMKYMNPVIDFLGSFDIYWYVFKIQGKHQVTQCQATFCKKIFQDAKAGQIEMANIYPKHKLAQL